MAVQRTGALFAVLLLAGALQISTVSAASASLSTSTGATSNTVDGFASASNTLRITSGEGSSVAFADSQAFVVAKNDIRKEIIKVIERIPAPPTPLVKETYCPEAAQFVESESQAIGIAGAKVTVDVVADVIIEGQGSGCANTAASGEAFAVAFADLFVDAIVSVGIDGFDEATAKATLKAKSNAFAAAFASATAKACLDGPGSSVAEQSVEAKALAKPIASILVFLEALVDCSGFSDTFAEAEVGALLEDVVTVVTAEGSSETQGKGDSGTTADAFAVTGRICTGIFDNCCKRLSAKRLGDKGTCYCNFSNRKRNAGCESTKNILANGSIFFEDNNSDFACACA